MTIDWQEVLATLEDVDDYIEKVEPDDHRPAEAVDGGDVEYCLGCEVGAQAQALKVAIVDYLEARRQT